MKATWDDMVCRRATSDDAQNEVRAHTLCAGQQIGGAKSRWDTLSTLEVAPSACSCDKGASDGVSKRRACTGACRRGKCRLGKHCIGDSRSETHRDAGRTQ